MGFLAVIFGPAGGFSFDRHAIGLARRLQLVCWLAFVRVL